MILYQRSGLKYMKYYHDDKEFGRVMINTRRGMRNVTARWQGDVLYLNVPLGITVQGIQEALDDLRPRLRARKEQEPGVTFTIGQVIECFRCRVRLDSQSRVPRRMLFGHDGDLLTLSLPVGMDLESDLEKRNVTHGLQVLLEQEAQRLLLPFATQVAEQLGVSPAGWEIGRGMRKLGHCTKGRVIQLSRNLMFLPERLVRYIICHDLAHLTHMNHSAAFHALVNKYTSGQEKALEQELKRFNWPIVR